MQPFLFKKAPRVFKFSLLLIGLCLISCLYFFNLLGPVDSEDDVEHLFVIKKGTAARQIAKDLKEEGLIKNARAFILYTRVTGNLSHLQAGHYLLKPAMKVQMIVKKLAAGQVAVQKFTIPEGYHLRQIAEVLAKNEIMTAKEFWAVVKEGTYDYFFLEDLPANEKRLEGYLFPDTYLVPIGCSAEEVVATMLKRFWNVYQALPANETGLTIHQVVTLASIVEGECCLDEERPIVASVFLNRLKRGQKLEADSTVQYALEERTQRVLYDDLEVKSEYNTYRISGLPPGPIGCPGQASLQAVLQAADTDYYYFVAKKDQSGEHVFSRTFAEHIAAKKKLGY